MFTLFSMFFFFLILFQKQSCLMEHGLVDYMRQKVCQNAGTDNRFGKCAKEKAKKREKKIRSPAIEINLSARSHFQHLHWRSKPQMQLQTYYNWQNFYYLEMFTFPIQIYNLIVTFDECVHNEYTSSFTLFASVNMPKLYLHW